MQEHVKDSGIYTIDALYYEPELAAIHLLRSGDKIALIDTGTQFSTPQVLAGLQQLGLSFDHVELIILTHIHLDHAGGASALMQQCPNAELIVHPRGARHMVDPSKLVAGATAVYGAEEFSRMYGEIGPIDAARISSPDDGDTLSLGDRTFHFIDSPGHARHHFCIHEQSTNSMFTGDTLGIAYPALRDPYHAFVMPTTTPVQFDPDALHDSIDRVMAQKPDWLYYTHYSSLQPSDRNIAGLHEQIDDYVILTAQVDEGMDNDIDYPPDELERRLNKELYAYLVRRAKNELHTVDDDTIHHWLKLDAQLNAQGLAFWWTHRRQ